MAIQFQMTIEGDLLSCQASGFDESLDEVLAYGMAVIEACAKSDCSRVLCDETRLEYRLGTVDTFQAAVVISEHAPHVGKVAIVPQPTGLEAAAFWEDVAVNRGLQVRVFRTIDAAWAWLGTPRSSPSPLPNPAPA